MKTKLFKFILLPVLAFSITGCNDGPASSSAPSSSSEEPPLRKEVNMEVRSNYGTTYTYEVKGTYDDSHFLNDATNLSKELAISSFIASASTFKLDASRKYYQEISFDDYHYSSIAPEDEDVFVTYAFAHKKIKDFDLISMTLAESKTTNNSWVDNFNLGLSGNHYGYEYEANNIISDLNAYLNKNYANHKLKLWITGYSRGAGLANMITNKLFDDTELNLQEKDVFTYTFEGPATLKQENIKGLKNVFNFVSSYDIVPNIIPESYGLFREGTDIDIFDKNLLENIKTTYTYLPDISFSTSKNYNNPKEFLSYFLSLVLSDEESDTSIATREKYMNNAFPAISTLIPAIMKLGMSKLKGLADIVIDYGIFNILSQDDLSELRDSLYNYFIDNGVQVDQDKFNDAFEFLHKLIFNLLPTLLSDLVSNLSNYAGMALSHFDEVNYYYLTNYNA